MCRLTIIIFVHFCLSKESWEILNSLVGVIYRQGKGKYWKAVYNSRAWQCRKPHFWGVLEAGNWGGQERLGFTTVSYFFTTQKRLVTGIKMSLRSRCTDSPNVDNVIPFMGLCPRLYNSLRIQASYSDGRHHREIISWLCHSAKPFWFCLHLFSFFLCQILGI